MGFNFLVILIVIILLILYLFFEAWGTYEFEPFAYNFGIRIKKIVLKTKVKFFDELKGNIYRKNNINYKFISNNICLIRLGSEDIHLFMYIRPIPIFNYKIVIKNNKYILTTKISFLYLVIIGFLLYELVNIISNNQKILFNDIFPLILYTLIFILFIILSLIKIKKIAILFLKIIKNKSL